MSFLSLWFVSGLVILVLMVLLWLLSLRLQDASIVDIFWGLGFVITYWLMVWIAGSTLTTRIILLGILVTIWGARLALYIYQRNHGNPEDFRYVKWRAEAGTNWWWQSFFKVFLLQGS